MANSSKESEPRAAVIAKKIASDPEVLKNVRESTRQFREGRTVPLSQLRRRTRVATGLHGAAAASIALPSTHVTQRVSGPELESRYAATRD